MLHATAREAGCKLGGGETARSLLRGEGSCDQGQEFESSLAGMVKPHPY